jgi:polysaccharide pyruvyl transferase WcaK-like protein
LRNSRIILYGHFGSGNVGNDSSLEAALFHVRKYLPDADILCVCNGPQEIKNRFGIETLPIDESAAKLAEHSRGGSRLKRVWFRLMDELNFWLKRPAWFQRGDQFMIVGTGAVDDMAVKHPWNAPYELYKWCKTAKMGGAQVIFLSVGVGPIVNRISRFLMLKALRMADYRSYRETAAFNYLRGIGFDTLGDSSYPDLVFSLPKESLPSVQEPSSTTKVVGLGLIDYYGWTNDPGVGETIYQEYFSKITRFAFWLFDQGYAIRIISGDATDRRPVQEFIDFLNEKGKPQWREKLVAEDIRTVNDLFTQIARTDIVVASRFHNVLCSLMLERPVISLGYHEKNANLMTEVGLEGYDQHIEHFTVDKLVEQFNCYTSDMEQAVQRISNKNNQYRQLLDEQYRNILVNKDLKTH